jgi:Sulfatase
MYAGEGQKQRILMRFAFNPQLSFRSTLVFWWVLLFLIQLTHRLFLLPETMALESPTPGLLAETLLVGLRADLSVATYGAVAALVLTWAGGWTSSRFWDLRKLAQDRNWYATLLHGFSLMIAGIFMIVLIMDMGYYAYNHSHLDYVFFEYLSDLITQGIDQGTQASRQTEAELEKGNEWGVRLVSYFFCQTLVILLWTFLFIRGVGSLLTAFKSLIPHNANIVMGVCVLAAGTGLDPYGPWAVQRSKISSSVYYAYAQNPIWYSIEMFRSPFQFDLKGGGISGMLAHIPLDQAIQAARNTIAPGDTFPYEQYPFVRQIRNQSALPFEQQPNVLLIFVEGLDRRFLGHVISPEAGLPDNLPAPPRTTPEDKALRTDQEIERTIHLTSFLDRLKDDSLYFKNFFTNANQTFHGMFSSLCSYYPRYGRSSFQALFSNDYLCLPSILQKGGYQTEMVSGLNRDDRQEHQALFLGRNGVQQFFDENNFPPQAKRIGLGKTDGDLFDLVHSRLAALQNSRKPFFISVMTASTHHPYSVPTSHPEVQALRSQQDGYLAALRYVDLELERFFTETRKEGLLHNTVVFIHGDHGRHEEMGKSILEQRAGHFMSPLFIWMDPSLRTPATYRPRIIATVASQVDLSPTILSITRQVPRIGPFLGKDLSCSFVTNCADDNFAFLSSVRHGLVGIADRRGVFLYDIGRNTFFTSDALTLEGLTVPREDLFPDQDAQQSHRVLALYVSSNVIREQNRLWSWHTLGNHL